MAGGVNILIDCTCTLTFAAADLGGGETYSNSTSFKADKVSIKETMQSADHSTAQDLVENHRGNKVAWEVTVETKLYNSSLLSRLRANALGNLVVTALTGLGLTEAKGLITGVEVDYAGPSTLKFSLKAHGSVLTYG